MSSAEADRHALYNRLTEVLGDEHAVTMMTYTPAIPADQILTKDDFKSAMDRIDVRFERIEDRLDRFDQQLHDHVRLFVGATVGAMTGLTAIYAFVVSLIS